MQFRQEVRKKLNDLYKSVICNGVCRFLYYYVQQKFCLMLSEFILFRAFLSLNSIYLDTIQIFNDKVCFQKIVKQGCPNFCSSRVKFTSVGLSRAAIAELIKVMLSCVCFTIFVFEAMCSLKKRSSLCLWTLFCR